MRYQNRYGWVGAILGLGAPLGALIWRFVSTGPAGLFDWLRHEWTQVGDFYVYMTLGTVTAFAIFGYVLGRRSEDLKEENEEAKGTVSALNLLAITDGLTGLYNHRYLHEMLKQEVERVERYKTPLSCLMLDIDDFKSINDAHGHPFGDHVLATMAAIIRDNVRRIDIVGRYGGEEFMVLMPHATAEVAEVIAERIRKAVEGFAFTAQDTTARITLSIGLATYPDPAAGIIDKDTFLNAADQALYRAKSTGKNRLVIYPPGTPMPEKQRSPKNS